MSYSYTIYEVGFNSDKLLIALDIFEKLKNLLPSLIWIGSQSITTRCVATLIMTDNVSFESIREAIIPVAGEFLNGNSDAVYICPSITSCLEGMEILMNEYMDDGFYGSMLENGVKTSHIELVRLFNYLKGGRFQLPSDPCGVKNALFSPSG